MLADFLLALIIIYAVKIVILGMAAFGARYSYRSNYRPSVSIIIAARNEEHGIRQCMDALIGLSYPPDLLEILIVNDGSSDRTGEIVREYCMRFKHVRLHDAVPGSGNLKGKANAVAQGIELSNGEILMFTDADCAVPVGWVEETVKYYIDPTVGVVAGFTSLRTRRWFDGMQALDWFVLFSVAAATVRLRYPVTAVGNNLSVRRESYDRIGGYRGIPFSVTEDYALFHAITRHRDYRAVFPMDPATLVESEPCRDWRDLFQQKKRWFAGGKGMDIKSLLVFTIPFVLNTVLLSGVFLLPTPILLFTVLLKTAVDFFLALPSLGRFNRWELVRHFLLFELYYTIYVVLFPLVVLLGENVRWKGRTFRG
jgi:cellulose synthase/poly-beta-1,6-N-acetylglucosamine synthase-like glycosyltransferase